MRKAISDSSPLIHLSAINRLPLLNRFYDHVIIPPAVWREVVDKGAERQGAIEVREASSQGWMKIVAPTEGPVLNFLRGRLDSGESEAIALALELNAEILLMDEEYGRSVGRQFGLAITGTVGILLRAKMKGLIPNLGTELDNLRRSGHFYLRQSIFDSVLKQAGE